MPLREQLEQALGTTYVIERELGGGGMSRVFVAEERALGRKVVLKVLPPELSAGINVERFKREIQLAATLQHPHIVPVFTAGDVDGMPYFTMPLVEGESLRARLQRGALPIAEALSILRDVSKALMYAHQHGVVHRDIKPDNVLISSAAACVSDFGVAKALTASTSPGDMLTATGVALGTPAYMSPEQASADPNVDARADIYAFGVLAYEMLTGAAPFAGRSPQQMLAAHMTETARPVGEARPSVPPALAALVTHCLDKRPEDRPQTAAEVLRDLDAISTPNSGTTPTSLAMPAAQRGVNRWAIAAMVLVVVGAVTATVVLKGKGKGSADMPVTLAGKAAKVGPYRPTSIVVAPFANMTGDSALDVIGAIAANSISDGLSQLDSIAVTPASTSLTDSAGRLQHYATADAVRTLGRTTNSQAVVWGTYYRKGDSLTMSAEIVNVSDGRTAVTLQPVTVAGKDPTAAIEALRDHLMSAIDAATLGERLGYIGRPPKVEAYREFLAGLNMQWNGGGTRWEFMAHYDQATRLDTSFTLAYYYAVQARYNLASLSSAPPDTVAKYFRAADSVFAILAPRRPHLGAVEQELYDEAKSQVDGNLEMQYVAQMKILARDTTLRGVNNVAQAALKTNRPAAALTVLKVWPYEKTPIGWDLLLMQSDADFRLGRYQDALAVAVHARLREPARSDFFNRELYARCALGDSVGVARMIDSVRDQWAPGATVQPSTAVGNAVRELVVHGHPGAARAVAAQGIAWIATRPDSERKTRQPALAQLYQMTGQTDSAFAVAERLSTKSDTRIYIEAMHGDMARAEQRLKQVDSVVGTSRFYQGRDEYERARVYAAMGKKEEAVAALTRGMAHGLPFDFNVEWGADFTLMTLRDYPPFQALLKPRGRE